jgi:hypothetical protein
VNTIRRNRRPRAGTGQGNHLPASIPRGNHLPGNILRGNRLAASIRRGNRPLASILRGNRLPGSIRRDNRLAVSIRRGNRLPASIPRDRRRDSIPAVNIRGSTRPTQVRATLPNRPYSTRVRILAIRIVRGVHRR